MRRARWNGPRAQRALGVLAVLTVLLAVRAEGAILVRIPNVPGDSTLQGYNDGTWFTADSFSFGVEREMKESGEKGGTQDINIGVGELQELSISKKMHVGSTDLMQASINGNSPGAAEVHFVETGGRGEPFTYLIIKLDRVFVKSWSTSGDADDRPTEEVAFYFNKIAIGNRDLGPRGKPTQARIGSWDLVRNTVWSSHGLTFPK